MRWVYVPAISLLATAVALAAPPEVPADLTVKAGKLKEVVIKPDGNKGYGFRLVGGPAAFRKMHSDDPKEHVYWLIPETDAPISIVWWTVGEKTSALTEVNKGAKPVEPDDVIPPPKPKPEPKPPEAVTSFRVLLIYESAATLTAEQKAVVYGVEMESAIRTATAGDAAKFGWRRLDKDADPSTLPAGLREVWAKAKPALTEVPCVVLQANDKITIESLPATPAEGASLVAKHRGK